MVPSGYPPVVYMSQYDVGRPIGFVVSASGSTPDFDNYTVTLEGTRSDGVPVTAPVTTDGNICALETTATMTKNADRYPAQIVVTDGNGDRIASIPVTMMVVKAAMDEDAEEIEEDRSLYQQYTGTVQSLIADIRTQLNAETAARQAAVSAEASARQAADNTLQSNINSEASTRATQDASLQSQINQLVAPSGEAPSAAEVENARVGADGTTYPTLGDAIRTQVTDVKSALTDIYVLKQYAFFESGYITSNGAIGSTVSLTRHADSSYESAVMACVPGDTFVVNLHAANAARGWCFIDSNNVMLEKATAGNRNETITAPENAAKVVFNNATDYPDKQVYKASGTDRITPLYDVREPFAYFTSNAQPTFTLEDGSITVSRNSGNFRIYTNKGLLKTFTALGTHTITNVQKLVYDLDDEQIKVVAGTQVGNYILLLSFAGNNFNGILYPYYLKQQFEDVNSRIDNATNTAAEDFALSNVADGSDFKAVFFSDIHGASANMTSILSFANENVSRVDAILNGGDTAARWLNDTTYLLTWYTDAITASSIDILSAIGNHDAWDGAYFTKASAVDIYNAFIAPIVAKYTGIVQPVGAAANGLCYYYKDYASKVRVVVLNAMDESTCDFWDSAQATWLADVLADAKTNDLAVVCVEHAPYPLPISVRNAKADNWSTWYPLQTDGVKLETEAMDIVANFMASGGKFVCWLSGHLHEDNLLEATGYPGQFMVNIVTADAGRRNKVGVNTAAPSPYFDGFNYIGVDTANGLLKVYRKGWDMDAGMKKHDYLCYDFVNHQVIAN